MAKQAKTSDDSPFTKILQISQVFRPGAPVDHLAIFAGRLQQLTRVINAVNNPGQHVIVYGERGVGKTSLANIVSQMYERTTSQRFTYIRVNCDNNDTFYSIWKKIFADIHLTFSKKKYGFNPAEPYPLTTSLDHLIDENTTPETLRRLLTTMDGSFIIAIDEVDRVKDQATITLLADTIKTFSDHNTDVTLMLVGVADSVNDLITEHASVERSLVQIQMPRMSNDELRELIDKALGELTLTIEISAKEIIVRLSQGLPHYTHLLGLHAAQHAVADHRTGILKEDVGTAINFANNDMQQSIMKLLHNAISSTRETIHLPVLLACALAPKDDLGFFAAGDVRAPLSKLMGRPYDINSFSRHLTEFCSDKRGPVLQQTGSARSFRFRFINPMLQPYVVMYSITKSIIKMDELLT